MFGCMHGRGTYLYLYVILGGLPEWLGVFERQCQMLCQASKLTKLRIQRADSWCERRAWKMDIIERRIVPLSAAKGRTATPGRGCQQAVCLQASWRARAWGRSNLFRHQ